MGVVEKFLATYLMFDYVSTRQNGGHDGENSTDRYDRYVIDILLEIESLYSYVSGTCCFLRLLILHPFGIHRKYVRETYDE